MKLKHVDILKFPPHVQETIRSIDLEKQVLLRAIQGCKWLDEHAPPDWRLQMISISAGEVSSRVRLCHDDENPLALAFRRVEEFKRPDGRVSWATIKTRFGFHTYEAQRFGFLEMYHTVGAVHIGTDIDSMYLDWAWAIILRELDWEPQPVAAYSQAA